MQEYEELIWHAGNLKLEVTEYSRQLYGSEGAGDDDDDDYDDDDNGGDGDGFRANSKPPVENEAFSVIL